MLSLAALEPEPTTIFPSHTEELGRRPGHHCQVRRPGGGQTITDAIDVCRRDVDAKQHGAIRDLALQSVRLLLRQPGGSEHRREAAGYMSGRFPKLRR